MSSNKMALIGRNISHSLSKNTYEGLLKRQVDYTLLDYESEDLIPELHEVLKTYNKVSVTAPYKEFIFSKIDVFSENFYKLNSVNAIKLRDNKIIGTNTDVLAFDFLLHRIIDKYKQNLQSIKTTIDILILGDGAMSKMITKVLTVRKLPFKILSRRNMKLQHFDDFYKGEAIIINTCAREYVFSHSISNRALFWDMNYNFAPHAQNKSLINHYIDGLELLKLQASFALNFWQDQPNRIP